ncbi:MAG: galactosyldiacylglycerol synthase [Chitinophagaceae bacterium]|nr:galactosyldiacylglycerol synthase [Rubrivivax sp.]
MTKIVELIYFNAGGGHRAAALALQQVMHQQARPWTVRLTNLTEVLDPQGLFMRYTGIQPEDIYNKRLASGFTLGLAQELKLLQAAIRLTHQGLVQRLRTHWLRGEPDLVVSLIPNFNRALCQSLGQVLPGVPCMTVLTDMADHPPHFWIEPDLPQHLVCGTAHAVAQALAAGCDANRVHRVSGMILRPDFYGPPLPPGERAARRLALGLPADEPTGLVLFGGHGSSAMKLIQQRLTDVPLILMCGRNATLAQTLTTAPAHARHVVVGFTPDVAQWMSLADFFIGKPGPGSLSEAVHMGLPVIVTRNAATMPQERWNTDWVREQGLGVVQRSFRAVRAAVADTVQRLPELQQQVRSVQNRAVFEVPDIVARLLDSPPSPDAAQRGAAATSPA